MEVSFPAPPQPCTPLTTMHSFPTPEGFEIPQGLKEGDTFEAMAEFQIDADNQLTLVGLEGCDCECDCGCEEEDEDEGSDGEYGKNNGKGFVNQIEIKFGSAGLDR